jgi:serpin B
MGFTKIIAVILALVLAACTPAAGGDKTDGTKEAENSATNVKTSTNGGVTILSGGDLSGVTFTKPEGGSETASAVANGANDFAFRLSAALMKNRSGNAKTANDSFICSPYSVWLPLAALLNAASDEAKPALLSALGAADLTAEDVNTAAARMLYYLTGENINANVREYGGDDPSLTMVHPLQIANAVFVDKSLRLNPTFADIFARDYLGTGMSVDFSDPSAVDAVNNWASEQTKGLITDIVQEFDPATVAAIANAIYFSDRWDWEFDEDETKTDTFHAPSGDVTAHFMLREGEEQPYYEDENLQAMPLRFKTGGEMYILLPKDGDANALLASMTGEYFTKITGETERREGKLLLPRFDISGDAFDLKTALESLGVPLFDAETSPLSGLIEGMTADVFLQSAVQKAMISVDEKGTTAAAVTMMAAAGAALPLPTEPFSMICDKPFVFILCGFDRDADRGSQVLFTGVVNQPGV